jgi:hypothetical protein
MTLSFPKWLRIRHWNCSELRQYMLRLLTLNTTQLHYGLQGTITYDIPVVKVLAFNDPRVDPSVLMALTVMVYLLSSLR